MVKNRKNKPKKIKSKKQKSYSKNILKEKSKKVYEKLSKNSAWIK